MQPRQQLIALLNEQGLTLDSLLTANRLASEIYFIDADVSALCLMATLRFLSDSLDDSQAVLTKDVAPYTDQFLPALKSWIETDENFHSPDYRDKAISTFRLCYIR